MLDCKWTEEEQRALARAHATLGNRWASWLYVGIGAGRLRLGVGALAQNVISRTTLGLVVRWYSIISFLAMPCNMGLVWSLSESMWAAYLPTAQATIILQLHTAAS